MGEQFKIIEYPLILLFIITGATFLISTNDLVSIFLSIELQSYGLYLLSTIYRNSELATTGGLIYFLLGGLSSCFILLGTALLYANSGTTNMDGLYIITSISEINDNYNTGCEAYANSFQFLLEKAELPITNLDTSRNAVVITKVPKINTEIFDGYKGIVMIVLLIVMLILCVLVSR